MRGNLNERGQTKRHWILRLLKVKPQAESRRWSPGNRNPWQGQNFTKRVTRSHDALFGHVHLNKIDLCGENSWNNGQI